MYIITYLSSVTIPTYATYTDRFWKEIMYHSRHGIHQHSQTGRNHKIKQETIRSFMA